MTLAEHRPTYKPHVVSIYSLAYRILNTMSERITFRQAFKSVLASFIGVQSKENHLRDASDDANLVPIFIVGVILAILLHVALYLIVKVIVWQSGVE